MAARWAERLRLLLTGVGTLILGAMTVYAIGDAMSAPTPAPQQPDFIDTLLGSRAVVVAIRLALIFVAAFVVASVVALIGRGQWLTRVGPVEVSEGVSDFDVENQRLEELLENAVQTIDSLEYELGRSNFLCTAKRRQEEAR